MALSGRLAHLLTRASVQAASSLGTGRMPTWHPGEGAGLLAAAGYERKTPVGFHAICAVSALAGALLGNFLPLGVVVRTAAGAVSNFILPFYLNSAVLSAGATEAPAAGGRGDRQGPPKGWIPAPR